MDRLAAFCLGIALCALLPALPAWPVLCLPLVALLPALRVCHGRGRALLWLVLALWLGLSWAALRGQWRLAHSLWPARNGTVVAVDAEVASLPRRGEFATRMLLRLPSPPEGVPDEVLASDYRRRDWPVGSRWHLNLRLRAPRAVANPHGFDAEAWYWSEGILATASIGKARIARAEATSPAAWLDRLRAHALARVEQVLGRNDRAALVAALALGVQGELSRTAWQQLAATGTIHLVSISGVHVTMLAALAAWAVAALLRRTGSGRLTPRLVVAVCALLVATMYALVAGFALPTQRTLLALAAACLMLLSRRRFSAFQVWWSVLALVLLVDPFAVLAPGMWLSFGLVAALLWVDGAQLPPVGRVRALLLGQWAILLLSLPALLYLFGQLPLLSPLANLFAIPWVTVLLTPLSLAALLDPSGVLLQLAGLVAGILLSVLAWLAQVPVWSPPAAPWPLVLLALLGGAGVLLGWPWPQRSLFAVLMLPLLLWRPPLLPTGQFDVRLIDVGQGLALLITTRSRVLLFDTGAGDAERILLPQLRAQGVTRLDMLLLSHHDVDHMGAAASLLAQMPATQVLSGQRQALLSEGIASQSCLAGQSWSWDGVRFDVLAPARGQRAPDDNAASCVLRIATRHQALLVTGDLPQAGEAALLARYGRRLAASVLVVGHHGSRSASSTAFLQHVAPRWALISAGYGNRYRHPHPDVLLRLAQAGARVARTDMDGMLWLRISDQVQLTRYRAGVPRYWRAGADSD